MIGKHMIVSVGEKDMSEAKKENETQMDTNCNKSSPNVSRAAEKYGLRPRTLIKRLQQERTRQEAPPPKRSQQRSKSRPAPLSKYRRKTANARERHRMKEINNAFESLRKALPDAYETSVSSSTTKISTLKLAVQYIQALSRVLDDASDNNFYSLEEHATGEDKFKRHYESSAKSTTEERSPFTIVNNNDTGSVDNNIRPMAGSAQSCFLQSSVVSSLSNSCSYSSSPPSSSSSSSSSCLSRDSLSSASDLEEFLSDDSALLEDNLDVFHDIQPLPGPDPFELLLDQGRENMIFSSDFCAFK